MRCLGLPDCAMLLVSTVQQTRLALLIYRASQCQWIFSSASSTNSVVLRFKLLDFSALAFLETAYSTLMSSSAQLMKQKLSKVILHVNTNGAAYSRSKHLPLFDLVDVLALHLESL